METAIKKEGLDSKETARVIGVVSQIDEAIVRHASRALSVQSKELKGVTFSLETEEGNEEVDFPREFSRPEKNAILGQQVEYIRTHSAFNEGPAGHLLGWEYKIRVLSGPEEGWEVELDITV